jgi:hypothetical protein
VSRGESNADHPFNDVHRGVGKPTKQHSKAHEHFIANNAHLNLGLIYLILLPRYLKLTRSQYLE